MTENIYDVIEIINFVRNKFNSASVDGSRLNSITGFENEYNALKETVGIRILTENTVIKLAGKDTLEFLHRVSTNDVKNLENLKIRNTLFTNEKGRLIDRTTLINFADYFLLLGGKGTQAILSRWIDKYIIMEDIKLTDGRNEFIVLELTGPQSESYLTQVCGKCIDELSLNEIKNFEMDELSAMIFKQEGNNNSFKYFIILKIQEAVKIIDHLLNQNNIFHVKLVGEQAYNHYRIEMGWPESPNEINANFNPYEAGLIDEVNFKKGCYIGQEVIARLDTYDKVQKKLCGVILEGTISNVGELNLLDNENKEIGFVTSLSPNSHSTIGLAIIRNAFAVKDNKLKAAVGNKIIDVTVTEIPFKK